ALAEAGHDPPRSGARRDRDHAADRGAAAAPARAQLMAVAARVRHFVSIADLSSGELVALLDRGAAMKAGTAGRDAPLRGMALAQIFEKPSLRTRLSFDVAMAELGGHSSYLSPQEVGLGRRESVADVARVASRLVDLVVLRTYAHETIEEFARYASVPVINGLSDLSHPCQGLADIFTTPDPKGLAGPHPPDAVVMHDMPAHRGEEITDEVLDGPRSVVLDQAENKMHMLKAVLCWLVGGTASPRPPLR